MIRRMRSSASRELKHSENGRAHGATHPEWEFRKEAIVWSGQTPIRPNLVPLASTMCLWLQRKVSSPWVCLEAERTDFGAITNPYAYHASAIGLIVADTINSTFEFTEKQTEVSPLEAEIKRVRLQNELVMSVARFCESSIKQMLFCTQIPRRLYRRAALGGLLAVDCDKCRKAKAQTHDISLLGALAHRYFLCHTLDSCVYTHLQLVARRRNLEAAHSDALSINPTCASDSRKALAAVLDSVGHEFGHMLDHIGDIESRMIAEVDVWLEKQPGLPSYDDLMRVPARPPKWLVEKLKKEYELGKRPTPDA